MSEDESPEVVAAASLSPVSPRPLHNTYTLPQVLPELQDQAEDPDVVPLQPTTFRTAAAAMAPEPDPTETLDTIVVEGTSASEEEGAQSQDASIAEDYSFDDSLDDSFDDSFDAYGDDGNGQEQEAANAPAAEVTAGPDSDDYARTFDSPEREEQVNVENEEGAAQQPQQEVLSEAPESMNMTDQPDAVPTQSASTQPISADPPIPSLSTQGSQPKQPTPTPTPTLPAQDAPAPTENGKELVPSAQEALPDTTSDASPIQQPLSSPKMGKVEADTKPEDAAAPKQEEADVLSEDVDMKSGGDSDATAIDIQKLVDEITANAQATSEQPPAKPLTSLQTQSSSSMDVDHASLPPKPALTQEQSKQTYSPASYNHPSLPNAPSFNPAPAGLPPQPSTYANNSGASGVPGPMSQPPSYSATPSFASHPNTYPPGTAPVQAPGYDGNGLQQSYEEFLADERKHMSEAKWERFPEGSRIFIGNLSQERVSKRDVFELFHRYGRLAQISLKSAYGFVQYHTVADAQAAMNALQGAEVKGRKINLEISRTQKSKKDRDHSPERRNRDRGGRGADRYDGRDGRRPRDDHRRNRSSSPRRDDQRGRQESYDRDRAFYDSTNRRRSRSPDTYGRHGQDPYRRRSPSPYGRGRQESDHLDIPRRYGNDVPDVQILLMQDVHKDFIEWVQRAFYERGLKAHSMFLNPRFPRDAVIQRQVLEGVHGVVELDMRAQNSAKIPLQVFDRSAGSNVRFDQYQDLEPPIAAQLVLRAKGSAAAPPPPPPPQRQQQQQQPAYPPPSNYPPQAYGAPTPYSAYPTAQQPPAATPDIASLMGQLSQMGNVDNSTLQTILASLQQPTLSHTPGMPPAQPGAHPAAANPQFDVNALINNYATASAVGAVPGMSVYPAPAYTPQGGRGPVAGPPVAGSSDPARDVENIMATLARIRQ